MLLPNKIIGGSCNIRYISSVGFVPGHNWLDRHWFLKRGTQYKCLSLEPFSGEFSWFWWGSINKYRCGITRLFANTLQGQKKYCFWRWWENGAAIWAESEGRSVVFVTRRQSMQQGDWNAFGDGNRWPFHFPLTCEPCYYKLLTASTGLLNGVTLYELWVWMPAVKHVHMRTQINRHILTPTDPAPLILHFQPLGPPVEVEGLDQ